MQRSSCVLALVIALSGCSTFPEAGPSAGDVAAKATAPASRFRVVDIDPAVTQIAATRRPESLSAGFGDTRPPAEPLIGVGDALSLTVWEAGAGGLFSAPMLTDRFTSGSKSAQIPEQVVGRDGAITVPYAGRVQVAGRRAQDVEAAIERALTGKAIQPQVLLQVTRPVSQAVTVGGEVANGARVPLTPRGDRLLDVIAQAGGVRAPVHETFVRLSRGGRTLSVPLGRVVADPHENIWLRPGDVVTLVRDPQTFQAFGATGRNAEVPFEAEGITLSQALAKAGGVQDSRADPTGVFLFRYEDPALARGLPDAPGAVESSGPPGRARAAPVPVVYRLNLRDPESFFLAQRFPLANRDVLYVSNAPLTEMEKALRIFNMVATPTATAASITTAVK
ncbi:MAG: polysaccharide biosynthesis/export family protein [Alsobacter sp.]